MDDPGRVGAHFDDGVQSDRQLRTAGEVRPNDQKRVTAGLRFERRTTHPPERAVR